MGVHPSLEKALAWVSIGLKKRKGNVADSTNVFLDRFFRFSTD